MPIFYQSIDTDTGEEIIVFSIPQYQMVRNSITKRLIRKYRGEPLAANEELLTIQARNQGMVRDAITKLFIRGFNGFTVQVALLFSYPMSGAKHANPLYVDVKLATFVPVDEVESIEDIEKILGDEAKSIIQDDFGEYVSDLATVVGVEHSATVTGDVYPTYHWYEVWHHYKNDQLEGDGTGTL